MADTFDPYHKWLGIPPAEQPPNLYRLLGLRLFESDGEVIASALDRVASHVRSRETGPRAEHARRLLAELNVAGEVLLNPGRKAGYDALLRRQTASPSPREGAVLAEAPPPWETAAARQPPPPPGAQPPRFLAPGGAAAAPRPAAEGADDESPSPKELIKRRKVAEAEMDMTPMVDVVFQLLIFFMVTASFSLQRTLQAPTPEETDQPSTQTRTLEDLENDPDYVTVVIDHNNTYRVLTVDDEWECPSQQEMMVKVRAARQGDKEGRVPTRLLVRAHLDCQHAKVVAALDAGSAAGMEENQLSWYEDDEGE